MHSPPSSSGPVEEHGEHLPVGEESRSALPLCLLPVRFLTGLSPALCLLHRRALGHHSLQRGRSDANASAVCVLVHSRSIL